MPRSTCLSRSALLPLLCLSAFGQEPQWRRELTDLMTKPQGSANLQDIRRFEENTRLAAPYLNARTPGDYEANRELIRRMTAYLAAMNMMARDPQMRFALRRANQALFSLRYAPNDGADARTGPEKPAPEKPAEAPYVLRAPDIPNVPESDKRTARDLQSRYEDAASRAVAAWQSAEVIKQNLAADGMTLNTQTATSITRIQLYLETAADALREQDWEDARLNIERAEYETEKVLKTVGR